MQQDQASPTTPSHPDKMAGQLLQAILPLSQIFFPTEPSYIARQASFWSSNAQRLQPACIIQPSSTTEVSLVLNILVQSNTPFAIRSGGHMNWAGANNIDGGVTIDLGLLRATVYDPSTQTVKLGPGATWLEVYTDLHKFGRAVAGGREGNVGVGGLIPGGGNTFFTARHGFACDNVISFEVVLANGEIVTADRNTHADLFRVLKGAGVGNFGIITEFTMVTIENDVVWGGMTFSPKQAIPGAISALVNFTEGVEASPDNNLIVIIGHSPQFNDNHIAALVLNIAGEETPAAFDEYLALPKMMDMIGMTTVRDMVAYAVPGNHYTSWFTLTFKNDARILTYASALHDQLVADLTAFIPAKDFTTQCLFQTMPKYVANLTAGGPANIMGMDESLTANSILFLAVAMVQTPEQEAFAYPRVKQWVQQVKQFAISIDGMQDWLYLNYADGKSQDVISSYGAANVQRIREASARYDPDGVFQRLCPGGYKVPVGSV